MRNRRQLSWNREGLKRRLLKNHLKLRIKKRCKRILSSMRLLNFKILLITGNNKLQLNYNQGNK